MINVLYLIFCNDYIIMLNIERAFKIKVLSKTMFTQHYTIEVTISIKG